jgi:RNA polymerase sigma-70 factor (ECF subfamily)
VAPRIQLDGRPDSLVRVAVRIARNLAVSEVRRLGSAPLDIDAIEIEAPMLAEPDPLLRHIVALCREKLPKQPAAALAARLEEILPDRELATRLGMQLNTFLQNVGRARKLLAECLQKQGVALELP